MIVVDATNDGQLTFTKGTASPPTPEPVACGRGEGPGERRGRPRDGAVVRRARAAALHRGVQRVARRVHARRADADADLPARGARQLSERGLPVLEERDRGRDGIRVRARRVDGLDALRHRPLFERPARVRRDRGDAVRGRPRTGGAPVRRPVAVDDRDERPEPDPPGDHLCGHQLRAHPDDALGRVADAAPGRDDRSALRAGAPALAALRRVPVPHQRGVAGDRCSPRALVLDRARVLPDRRHAVRRRPPPEGSRAPRRLPVVAGGVRARAGHAGRPRSRPR